MFPTPTYENSAMSQMDNNKDATSGIGSGHSPAEIQPRFGDQYRDFGCTVNSISVEDLFTRYESSGFLYPAKRQRLMPYMATIMDNWRRSMSAPTGSMLHDVVVYENQESGAWASVTVWATTNAATHSQHLVSIESPAGTRAALLGGQSEMALRGELATQSWFRPQNRYPARVFGSCVHSLGQDRAVVHEHAYLRVDRRRLPNRQRTLQVDEIGNDDGPLIDRLAQHLCGPVLARADEWDTGDVRLDTLDRRYSQVGLRRFRRVFIVCIPGKQEPIGFAAAYRGPLGLNFSFLENRCELWIDPEIDQSQREDAAAALIHAASGVYHDFELPDLLITAVRGQESAFIRCGATLIQQYNRSVWLREGYEAWYNHVDGFYDRIKARANEARRRVDGRTESPKDRTSAQSAAGGAAC